ncbi:MAG TPA: hypothetical protein VFG73_09920 [Rhodanobacteraceae bacterium]|nr:hypothetical protein [Rhodanobacteraceae bacterium]
MPALLAVPLLLAACNHSGDSGTSGAAATAPTAAATASRADAGRYAPANLAREQRKAANSDAPSPSWLPHPTSAKNRSVAAPAPAFMGFATVGVPACDDLGKAVLQCLNAHGAGKAQAITLHGGFAGQVVGWRRDLAQGATQGAVAQQCKQYRAMHASAYQGLGCASF